MPNWKELQMQLAGLSDQERNQIIARAVKSGTIYPEKYGEQIQKEAKPEETEISAGPPIISEAPKPQFGDMVKRMAENYQTSPQYQQLLNQELEQISAQIAELTQRRNMIEMAIRGTK